MTADLINFGIFPFILTFNFPCIVFLKLIRMKHRMFNVRNLIHNPQIVEPSSEIKPSSAET